MTKDNNHVPKSVDAYNNNIIINSHEEMVKMIHERIELANKEI